MGGYPTTVIDKITTISDLKEIINDRVKSCEFDADYYISYVDRLNKFQTKCFTLSLAQLMYWQDIQEYFN